MNNITASQNSSALERLKMIQEGNNIIKSEWEQHYINKKVDEVIANQPPEGAEQLIESEEFKNILDEERQKGKEKAEKYATAFKKVIEKKGIADRNRYIPKDRRSSAQEQSQPPPNTP